MTDVDPDIYLAFRAAGVDEEQAKAATLAIMAYGNPRPPKIDLDDFVIKQKAQDRVLQWVALGMFATAWVGIIAIAVTLILRG